MKNGAAPKTVLVAGGAGFLGSHLVDALLAQGDHVITLDNLQTGRRQNIEHLRREPRFEFIEADIVRPLPASLKARKFDRIFNLACPASPPHYQADPEHTLLTSVVGTHALLKLAERSGARFLMASTSEVYGDPEMHPQKETYWGHVNPTGIRACYDEGKRAAETLCFDFDRHDRVEVRVARIFNTYGPRLPAEDGRVVSNVVNQALTGEDITVYGDGSQTRSFCFVEDLIDGLMRLMAHDGPQPGPVNLGNPTELTINELVERVVEMTNSVSRIVRRPLPKDDPQRRRPDITKAGRLLGWQPRTSVEDGLEATIAWYAAEIERAEDSRPAAAGAGAVAAV
ncbi:MAG TPA: UDP-glucuronic acid decarboxylase family protein [Caulobacteraceae bacterium]|jgi:UDP-glucuronate decarboxylase